MEKWKKLKISYCSQLKGEREIQSAFGSQLLDFNLYIETYKQLRFRFDYQELFKYVMAKGWYFGKNFYFIGISSEGVIGELKFEIVYSKNLRAEYWDYIYCFLPKYDFERRWKINIINKIDEENLNLQLGFNPPYDNDIDELKFLLNNYVFI